MGQEVSELDAANAAPPASDTERKSALGWIAVIALLGVIALIVAGVYSYKSHKAEVATIVNKPVVVPPLVEPAKEKKRKTATEKAADKASDTKPDDKSKKDKKDTKPVVNDGFTSEFDKRLAEFERKIP